MKRKFKVIQAPNDAENRTLTSVKVRPNDPCPCGSGKKAKKCCGTETAYKFNRHIRTVVPESQLMKNKNITAKMNEVDRNIIAPQFCYNVGQTVVMNEFFPEEDMREKKAIVTDRGLDSDAYDPYYKIDIDGVDFSKWVAEYCLSPLIDGDGTPNH